MRRVGHIILLLFFLILTVCCTDFGINAEENQTGGNSIALEEEFPGRNLVYGIPVDSLKKIDGKIRTNRFLSDILLQYGVTYPEVNQAIENSKDVFDVRKMVSGNSYSIYCDTFPALKARYFLYEHSPEATYVFSLGDSLNITEFIEEKRVEIKFASGTIETSLWEAIVERGYDPMLAIELSEIFAWTVDFFGLQKGDTFKAIYEEEFVGDRSLGISRICGARYTWSGKPFTAIPFIQDSVESYFDMDGASLRKAFLKAPLRYSRISSRYSSARLHPILRIVRPHHGVDYAAPIGTPVVSVGDGRVISASYDASNGNMVKIQHNSVHSTAYIHLSRFASGIKAGTIVKQGDVIGYVGSTGLSTGPHLDFRFYVNGSPVDPLKVEAPSVDPVLEENMEKFNIARTVVNNLLDSMGKELQADSLIAEL